jgi:hypothetical protein
MPTRILKILSAAFVLAAISSCGGGGPGPEPEPEVGVFSGVSATLDLNWENFGGDGGIGGGADGDGGVGAGGDFGQFRGADVFVFFPDGTPVGNGSAKTDSVAGMITIKPGKTYNGPLYIELRGNATATYYEEGKDAFVPFPAGRVLRAILPRVDKNIGLTPFTDAAYRLLLEGSTPERVASRAAATPDQIRAANNKVRDLLNQQFPAALSVDDITRLPFIKSPSVGAGAITTNPRGVYGLVNGAFSKQAAMYNAGRSAPTLDAVKQLGEDLLDGQLDGMNAGAPAAPADERTYDPNTLTGEITSALAEQSFRFGDALAKGVLPKVLNFGNTRYEGYLFDAKLTPDGKAFSTVSGWVAENSRGFTIGQNNQKIPSVPRVFGVYGNMGHGGAFLKTDAPNSQSEVYALGDNVNGELGLGDTAPTRGAALKITLPGILTHAAGGFAHTVVRLADGSVYAWGDNSYGQLGQGVDASTLPRSLAPLRVTLPTGVVAVASTNTASYALLQDGRVFAWGSSGGFGLLGNGLKTGTQTTPTEIGGLSGVVQISARDNDVVVLRRDNTIWQWGSFPADPVAFVPGDPSAAYAGGTPTPTQVAGIPTNVAVRKILTEQGISAALMADGSVRTWGVYFDLSAKEILRDTIAVRVLGLPPLRDIMPGGFQGYGDRAFDRLTAMGIDYRGGMWKVRGRVGEVYDPENPSAQRRPDGDARPNCISCHTFLDQSLAEIIAAQPNTDSQAACLPPETVHNTSLGTLIHAETECALCHNPSRQNYVGVLVQPFAQSGGWKNCSKPVGLPPRTRDDPPLVTTACVVPPLHAFTPPGTVCASCHNSVVARPLSDYGCAQPSSGSLPTIPTTATVSAAATSTGTAIARGGLTNNATPRLTGTTSSALVGDQVLTVLRNGAAVGTATVTSTSWAFSDAGGPQGLVSYAARVTSASTGFGATSASYAFTVDTIAPTAAADVTTIRDDNTGTALADNGFTSDTTPTIEVAVNSTVLDAGDVVQVLRGGTVVGNATQSGNVWRLTDSTLAGGAYSYRARVVDAAGNQGALGATRTVNIVTNLPTVTNLGVANGQGVPIAAGSSTAVNLPVVSGTTSAAPSGNLLLRVLVNGTPAGVATWTGTNWSFAFTTPLPDGLQQITARSESGGVPGTPSAAYGITVDTLAPAVSAPITGFFDSFAGQIIAAGSTSSDPAPSVRGTLSAALGTGEVVRVFRNGSFVGNGAVTSLTWLYDEPASLASGTYTYRAQVFDAAGNPGPNVQPNGQSITLNLAVRTARVLGATNNSVAPTGAIGSGAATRDTTPLLNGDVNQTLSVGQTVVVLRDGVAMAGTAAVTGTTWSYTDPGAAQGAHTYTARVDAPGLTGATGTGFAFTVDSIAPAQTLTSLSATRSASLTPLGIAGAVPSSNTISGISNDPNPTFTIQLSAGLAGNESVEVLRSGGVIATLTTANCGAGCFQFTYFSGTTIPTPPPRLTDNLTAGTSPVVAPASATTASTYQIRVRDSAGNVGATQGSLSFAFDYFNCNQVRADATYATVFPGFAHTTVSTAAASGTRCSGCHRVQPADPATGAGTPAGNFVAVPRGNAVPAAAATYWCRRPS